MWICDHCDIIPDNQVDYLGKCVKCGGRALWESPLKEDHTQVPTKFLISLRDDLRIRGDWSEEEKITIVNVSGGLWMKLNELIGDTDDC